MTTAVQNNRSLQTKNRLSYPTYYLTVSHWSVSLHLMTYISSCSLLQTLSTITTGQKHFTNFCISSMLKLKKTKKHLEQITDCCIALHNKWYATLESSTCLFWTLCSTITTIAKHFTTDNNALLTSLQNIQHAIVATCKK